MDCSGRMSGRFLAVLIISGLILAGMVGGAVYLLTRISEEEEPQLVIYAYESFQSYKLGPAVIPLFEEMYGVNVSVVTPGDVGSIRGRMFMERDDPQADVVIGVDNSMLHTFVDLDLLEQYIPATIDRLDPTMSFDPDHYVVPFDYGYIAMICSGEMMAERGIPLPDDIMDLADPVYDGQLLLLDPRTSSTGSSFMIWAASVAGEDYPSYFDALADNANGRVIGSWDAMFTAWEAGEAPIAISYGLDTAYEVKRSGTNNTITVVPDHQGYRQIEGAGLVKGAGNRDMAQKFLDFILTDGFQSQVYKNYMLPVVPGVEIDPMFVQYGVYASEHVEPTTAEVLENYDDWLTAWDDAFL